MRDDNPFEDRGGGSIDRGFLIAAVIVLGAVAVSGAFVVLGPKLAIRFIPVEESADPYEAPAANAPPPPAERSGPPPRQAKPQWKVLPAPAFPWRAGSVHEGSATLDCVAMPDERLRDCRIIAETPPGHGFGENALSAMRDARIAAKRVDGAPVRSRVRFTVRYRDQD